MLRFFEVVVRSGELVWSTVKKVATLPFTVDIPSFFGTVRRHVVWGVGVALLVGVGGNILTVENQEIKEGVVPPEALTHAPDGSVKNALEEGNHLVVNALPASGVVGGQQFPVPEITSGPPMSGAPWFRI